MNKYNTVLSIAGSDPSGGAGIQADLKTCTALGCYGMSVITNITIQNTEGVQSAESLSPKIVTQQLKALLSDININAIKIGMLGNEAIMLSLFNILKKQNIPIVLDPILSSTNGFNFYKKENIDALKEKLISISTIITPNITEAETLSGSLIKNSSDMKRIAKKLCENNLKAVLITGGHLSGSDAIDILYIKKEDQFHELRSKKIKTENLHGTGCTLSTAIACYLSLGKNLYEAIQLAKTFITKAIIKGANYRLGKGNGPLCHLKK